MIIHILKRLSFCFAFLLILSSCNSVKNLTYFQKTNNHSDTLSIAKPYVTTIKTGDILSIYVNSLSPEASSFFNPYGAAASQSTSSTGISQPQGYLVDAEGQFQFPIIGSIKAGGLTTSQVGDTLKARLKDVYLKDPTIIVRLMNFKITFLGEVAKPEVYNIPNELVTLPEAIGMAGDLTPFAQRDSIQVIRVVNNKRVVGNVNLNNRDVFSSPYYYLQPNDIVYVKPSKYKAQHNDRYLTFISAGISVVSILFLILRR